jgi:hypothetical protein
MPCIAQIPGGIKIEMYPGDHHPPHFHAIQAEDEALFRIVDLVVFKGSLPAASERAVRTWASQGNRQYVLAFNWVLCVALQMPRNVP